MYQSATINLSIQSNESVLSAESGHVEEDGKGRHEMALDTDAFTNVRSTRNLSLDRLNLMFSNSEAALRQWEFWSGSCDKASAAQKK